MSAPQTFSPRQIAEAVGLSESSIKRWADGGALAYIRTAGGHRRITQDEAVRFVRSQGLRVLKPDLLGLGDASVGPDASAPKDEGDEKLTELLCTELRQNRPQAARHLLLRAFESGVPAWRLCDGPIQSCLSELGEAWRDDRDRGIVLEHAAVDVILQTLSQIRARLRGDLGLRLSGIEQRRCPLAIGGAPSRDPYLLGSTMAATTLVEIGFEDLNLGPDTPLTSLTEAVASMRPTVAWLSSSGSGDHPRAADLAPLMQACDQAGAVLFLGGRGFQRRPVMMPPPHRTLRTMSALAESARVLFERWTPTSAPRAHPIADGAG